MDKQWTSIAQLAILGGIAYAVFKFMKEAKEKKDEVVDWFAKPFVNTVMTSDVKVPAGNFVLPNGALIPVAQTKPTVVNGTGRVVWNGTTYTIGTRNADGNWPLRVG
jgi:hypothetical protein